jgi:LuxR family maltose regulon positive regulatory protein
MSAPLLMTKLYIPPARPELVTRPRLLEQLNQGLASKLILVSAPAGFGKTTLLSVWLSDLRLSTTDGNSIGNRKSRHGHEIQNRVAWVSLDGQDNDPAHFLAYLIAALQSFEADAGQGVAHAPQSSDVSSSETALARLLNRLHVIPDRLVLVLDDYHLITVQKIHDSLAFLLDHMPPNLHLVIATRGDPPLPLARLRARGQLTELRQSDLRFTTGEATAFLNNVMGLNLSAQDVAALEARTEGWIAGLQMAALSLQGHSPHPATRSEFVQAFTGSHRFVLDYLVEEVLDQQPLDLQEFLLKTSILERLTGPLCNAVLENWEIGRLVDWGGHQSTNLPIYQTILEQLDAANLFIIPLDHERRWYRYHRLFSDLLRKRLRQTSPDLVPELHRRASVWHEQQGLMAAAIDHALAANDFERAATLVEENVETTLMRSEVTTFLNWVEKLPDESVRRRPTLCFFHAWALLMSGRSLDVVEQRLQDIDCAQEMPETADSMTANTLAGRMAAFRAYLMVFRADMDRAAELCHEALEHLPESDLFLRNIVAWILSLARLADGTLQDGKKALKEVAQMGQEIGNPLIAVAAICHQATLQMRQGRLHRAQEIFEQALHLATDAQGQRLPVASEALIGLGELERQWNNLEAAADYLAEGIELASQWSELAAFDAYFPLVRVRLAQGDVEAAREAIQIAQQIAHRSEATELDDLIAELQQAYFAIAQGDVAGGKRWAEKRGLVPGVSPEPDTMPDEGQDFVNARLRKYEQLVLVRLFIIQGRTAEALDLLEALLAQARQLDRTDLTIEIQILRALVCQAESNPEQAMEALAEALSLAEPGGYMRVFLDQGQPMRSLISNFRFWLGEPARQIDTQERNRLQLYADKLLAAFPDLAIPGTTQIETPKSKIQNLVEPLSERELEVLRLLATGMSNPEIADELVIAVSTVRSHCKSIYGKLDVHKRWDAVQRGQELGLI